MTMNNSFKEMLKQVKAEEELKNRTLEYIAEKTDGYSKAETKKPRYYYYATVCAACVLLTLFGGYRIYFTSVAEISIDINPSIELSVNRFDQVISVTDFNSDGKTLAESIDVKHKNYMDAIEEIMNNDMITALFAKDEIMTLTVAGLNKKKSDEILTEVEKRTAEKKNTYCYTSPCEDTDTAHKAGLSCGKYRAYTELHQLDPGITPEEVQAMTMREIRERIAEYSTDSENSSPSEADREHQNEQNCNNGGYSKNHGNKGSDRQHLDD